MMFWQELYSLRRSLWLIKYWTIPLTDQVLTHMQFTHALTHTHIPMTPATNHTHIPTTPLTTHAFQPFPWQQHTHSNYKNNRRRRRHSQACRIVHGKFVLSFRVFGKRFDLHGTSVSPKECTCRWLWWWWWWKCIMEHAGYKEGHCVWFGEPIWRWFGHNNNALFRKFNLGLPWQIPHRQTDALLAR